MSRTLVVVVTLALTLFVAPIARAGVAPATASQLVTLSTNGTVCPFNAAALVFNTRIAADGTTSTFAIPTGKIFIISSFDGVILGGPASSAQDLILLVAPNFIVATAPKFTLDSSGFGAEARDLTTPFALKSGTTLCIGSDSGTAVFRSLVHGFFAKDK